MCAEMCGLVYYVPLLQASDELLPIPLLRSLGILYTLGIRGKSASR